MTVANTLSTLPRASLDHLAPIVAGLPVLARLGLSGHGSSAREVIEKALLPLYRSPSVFGAVLSALITAGHIVISRGNYCRITKEGRRHAERALGPLLGRDWGDVLAISLVALSLGYDASNADVRQFFSRRDNMECAALARLYGVGETAAIPSRNDLRAALLCTFVAVRPHCETAFTEVSMRNTSQDIADRSMLLAAAGLSRGTQRESESALLRRALGLRVDGTSAAIPETLVRNAIAKTLPRTQNPGAYDVPANKNALQAFATAVRDLAKTLRTDPFAGRVAIAQVYDAGATRRLDFGSLDEFKARIAEAGRAGMLDLERYDIAGPMDNALRERSRTAFGRDERHFIVNEWI
jgi:hypothetical protein